MNVRNRVHQAIVITVFGPIYLTAVPVFRVLEGRDGVAAVTAEFRTLIPTDDSRDRP